MSARPEVARRLARTTKHDLGATLQPFDEEIERTEDGVGPKRRSGVTIVVVLAVVALLVFVVVLHFAGGAPTHGR